MRYKLTVAYVGKNFCGWQRQNNGRSVQSELEKSLSTLFGETIVVHSAGRTDEGVSAVGQVVNFDSDKPLKPFSVTQAVNLLLPDDVSAVSCEAACDSFDARKQAKSKTYVYRIYVSPSRNAVLDLTHAQIYKMPDVDKMKRAAASLVGVHNFKAFCATGGNAKTYVREIFAADVEQKDNLLKITVKGNAFLYNMIRIVVGTLVAIGENRLPETAIDEMLTSGNRKKGGKTFPSVGLCLEKVEY